MSLKDQFRKWLMGESPPEFYWQLDLNSIQYDKLLAFATEQRPLSASEKKALAAKLLGARRMDIPLVAFPWTEVEDYAFDNQCSIADALYDLTRRATKEESADA